MGCRTAEMAKAMTHDDVMALEGEALRFVED
jgi:hypothetical protein